MNIAVSLTKLPTGVVHITPLYYWLLYVEKYSDSDQVLNIAYTTKLHTLLLKYRELIDPQAVAYIYNLKPL